METAMSTVESLPQAAEPAKAAELVEAGVAGESQTQLRTATPATLPVAATVPPLASTPSPVLAKGSGVALLGSLREAAGQVIPQLQYQISRLGIAGQAGLGAFAAAAVLVIAAVIPAHHALQSLQSQIVNLQHPLSAPGVEPAVPRLVASLPTRGQIPAVIGQIYNQAQTAGVPLNKGQYAYVPAKAGTVGRYEVEFPVTAAYPAVRAFIDGTLTAVPAASLGKLHIERKAVGEQAVNADIGFIVFVRGEGQP
jgi:hypothetical protein